MRKGTLSGKCVGRWIPRVALSKEITVEAWQVFTVTAKEMRWTVGAVHRLIQAKN